jgi:hypothetical protein
VNWKARVWTGPTSVGSVAAKLREAGVTVTVEGTEHVHVLVEATEPAAVAHNLQATLLQHFGAGNGWWWVERNTQVIGEPS